MSAEDEPRQLLRLAVHETRTPLNAILGFTELLLAGAAGPLAREPLDYVQHIARSARAMTTALRCLEELAHPAPPCAGARTGRLDPLATMAEAGFEAEREVGRAWPDIAGDPATWRRIGELCRGYLEGPGEGSAAPRGRLGTRADGRLQLELWAPAPTAGDGTGQLTLELARRLAAREGADLASVDAARIVILLPSPCRI